MNFAISGVKSDLPREIRHQDTQHPRFEHRKSVDNTSNRLNSIRYTDQQLGRERKGDISKLRTKPQTGYSSSFSKVSICTLANENLVAKLDTGLQRKKID
jgi:hypothetical protein